MNHHLGGKRVAHPNIFDQLFQASAYSLKYVLLRQEQLFYHQTYFVQKLFPQQNSIKDDLYKYLLGRTASMTWLVKCCPQTEVCHTLNLFQLFVTPKTTTATRRRRRRRTTTTRMAWLARCCPQTEVFHTLNQFQQVYKMHFLTSKKEVWAGCPLVSPYAFESEHLSHRHHTLSKFTLLKNFLKLRPTQAQSSDKTINFFANQTYRTASTSL